MLEVHLIMQLWGAHHCYNDFMLFKTLENSEIFYPGSENEFKTQLKTSYANNKITLYRITAHPHNYQIKTHKNTNHKLPNLNNGSKLTIICTAPLQKNENKILLKNIFLKKKNRSFICKFHKTF